MSFFSNLDTALQEKTIGKGRQDVNLGSIGVCLDDSGCPVKLYIVDTIFACGSMDVFPLDKTDPNYDLPRQVNKDDFWALT